MSDVAARTWTTYDASTALVVVDLQNDFADPAGGLHVAGGEDLAALLGPELRAAREAGAVVVLTQDWHPPRTPHFDTDGGPWPVHCVAGTWGAELVGGLDVREGDPLIRKGTDGEDGYSGFSVRDPVTGDVTRTALQRELDSRGVRRVVVTGLAGDVCVAATALDAVRLGYSTVLPAALTRFVEREPGDGDRTLRDLREAGVEVLVRAPTRPGR
ncbi:isochorismatase family protein [Aquipuribacter sp. MA13-6]|uniref:isochorismatase family protein n=1 Tax=unclassified Aquipuribacter TaxID=2635084 RepID=UPI003EE9E180